MLLSAAEACGVASLDDAAQPNLAGDYSLRADEVIE